MDTNESLDLRDAAHGIALRAGLLTAGGLFIGGWITMLALKVAGKAIHLLAVLGAGMVLIALGTYEVKKVQHEWQREDVSSLE